MYTVVIFSLILCASIPIVRIGENVSMCAMISSMIYRIDFVFVVKRVLKENVAIGKTAWQRHPWPNDRVYGVERAVDGRYSKSSEDSGQCAISENHRSTAEWRIDPGRVLI